MPKAAELDKHKFLRKGPAQAGLFANCYANHNNSQQMAAVLESLDNQDMDGARVL